MSPHPDFCFGRVRRLARWGARASLAGVLAGAAHVALAQVPPTQPAEAPLTLRATPMLAEQIPDARGAATFVSGEQISGRPDLETTVTGNAELRRPGLAVRGHEITFDQTTDTLRAEGGVRVRSRGNLYTATRGELQLDSFEGFLLQPAYHFLASGAHGEAARIDFLDRDRAVVSEGNYTTCPRPGPDWVPDWILRAATLDIDREADVGKAQGAVLEFQGVPILPLPAMSFSLTGARKSGWLPPTFGLDNKSGLTLTLPYYWNIAPNRDATFTPTVMLRRGVDFAGQFRYLESNYGGEVNANFMPNDRLRQRNRWGVFTRHTGTYDSGLDAIGRFGLSLNVNRVSDNDYWRDFNGRDLAFTTRLLATDGGLSWSRGDFSANLRALKWQTLQDIEAPIVPPYDRLPQLTSRWGRINGHGGFDYSIRADLTRFRADTFWTHQPDADRGFVVGEIGRPFIRSWGFLKPQARLHATRYRFGHALADGARSANRVIPTASLDGGLVFERATRFFGRAFEQTLEPRLKYVYTPYRNQSAIPNYDSGAYDFNFATIWADNAFAGDDRIADNNLVTAGLTSRLLDPTTGAEALRLSIAQRYRFSPQRVFLPGGLPEGEGWSDVMLGAGVHWTPSWSVSSVVQYNPDTNRSTRATVNTRWRPEPFHALSAAYRYQRDLDSEHVDVGWQWPLSDLFGGGRKELGATTRSGGASCSGRWYSVGRLNYSLRESRLTDAIAGFEYDAGCWVGRIVVEKLQSGVANSTKRIMFQLELVGLASLGTSPLRTLRDQVPGYQALHQDRVPAPSRFMNYE